MSVPIEVHAARKRFGAVTALDDVSFHVETGEMFGVIGPDGAGKTTLLRGVCGLLRLDGGEIRVMGVDPFGTHRAATASIGYLSQRFSLYGDLSIDENIEFFARIHGVHTLAARRDRLLDLTGLTPFRSRLADRLSGGMKQKLALTCTLVHEPQILVLDEPTTGVDPVSRREFWKLLAEFRAQGLTMLLATPYLDEAERCGRVALLDRGRVLALDEPGAMRRAMTGQIVEIVATPPRQALEAARARVPAGDVQLFGDRLHVRVHRVGEAADLQRHLEGLGIDVTAVRTILPTLEDVFIERLAG